nr:alpha/beta hydrolase fold domain-containing protein [Xanthomonas theicola]
MDPARIAVAGDSADGGLAAMACQLLRGSAVALRAQVLFYPGTDLSPAGNALPARRSHGAVPPLTLELMQAMSAPFLSSGLDPRDPRLSPLQAADFSGLPPALVFTADCDALLDDGRLYAEALRAAGVPVEYVERRSQDSSATRDLNAAMSASIASLGVFQPSVWRGRVFISNAM